jgi:WD40 repeat protein
VTTRATPYQGLVPYSEQDADFFFGRDTEIELIIANLAARRFTLLYGPSGVGKSSVLRAGVAHHLRQRARENARDGGSPEFATVVFSSWRDDPIAGLIERVNDEVQRALSPDDISQHMASNEPVTVNAASSRKPLQESLQDAALQVQGDLLLILDQFEEYFLYHGAEEGDATFATELSRLLTTSDARVNVLISIREDALAKMDRFEGRIPNLFKNFLRVEHLDRAAAQDAIENPIARFNELNRNNHAVTIEPALVAAVLDQVRTGRVILGETGEGAVERAEMDEGSATRIETPYLQLVMMRLWDEEQRAGSAVLRLETLERLGSAEKIVRTHLDTTMNALPPAEQEVASRVFRYLVTPSGAKIAHTAKDLSEYAGLTPEELTPTLEKLASGDIRILRPVAPPLDQPSLPRYEIFHDVLGAPILDWRARYVQAQEKIASEQALANERARVRRLRLGLIGLSLLLLAVIALAVFAFTQQQAAAAASAAAEQQKQEALTQKEAAEKAQADANLQKSVALSRDVAANALSQIAVDPERALLLAIQAAKTSPTEASEGALRATLNDDWRATLSGHTDAIVQGNYSPDGSLIATASKDGTIVIWDVATRKEIARIPWNPVDPIWFPFFAFAFSSDSQLIALADGTGIVQLWQAREGKLLQTLIGHTETVKGVNFSPSGQQIVSWGNDNTVRVWDVESGKQLSQVSDLLRVSTALFSPDGKLLLTSSELTSLELALHSSDRALRTWDASTGELDTTFDTFSGQRSIFSPDGKYILSIEGVGVEVFSAQGTRLSEMRGPADVITTIAFSPDSNVVLAGSGDGTGWLWDPLLGILKGILGGHKAPIRSAVFSPLGRHIVTASDDQTVRLWYYGATRRAGIGPPSNVIGLADTEILAVQFSHELLGHSAGVKSALFSPDGSSLLSVSDDHTARIWNMYQGTPLVGHTSVVTSAAFSPDGDLVVTASGDGTARVWEMATGKLTAELRTGESIPTSAIFSPDGSRVATAGSDGIARIWDPRTGKLLAELKSDLDGSVNTLAFSPDGKWLVVAQDCPRGQNPTTCTVSPLGFDAGRGALAFQGPPHGRGVASVTFSPDGESVLSMGKDNTALLWELSNREPSLRMQGAAPRNLGVPGSGQVSPDGKIILTLSAADGVPHIWDARTGKLLYELRGHKDIVTDAALSPDGSLIVTASDDGTARVWEGSRGDLLFELKGHVSGINSVAFSPNSKLILTSSDDYTARLWDAATGKLWRVLRDHTKTVNDAIFSPDGKWIVTVSNDGTAQVFPCDICGLPEELLAAAEARATRELTCQERQTFLHESIECANQ